MSHSLPVFPWDTLVDAAATARAHPGGIVDLSVGTPVDPVAPLIQQALTAAAAEPGYPYTAGTPRLRASAVAALSRRYGVTGLAEHAVLPVIGIQGTDRLAAHAAGPRRQRHRGGPRTGLPHL